jgi:precorrin-2 methylase
MLYLVGLGLADEKDITVKGLEVIKKAERVYLEAYTAVLLVDKDVLEAFYGRPVIIADREMVESSSDDILKDADKVDVAFLVVGDVFGYASGVPTYTAACLITCTEQQRIPTSSSAPVNCLYRPVPSPTQAY